jgi:hypothetical protein
MTFIAANVAEFPGVMLKIPLRRRGRTREPERSAKAEYGVSERKLLGIGDRSTGQGLRRLALHLAEDRCPDTAGKKSRSL